MAQASSGTRAPKGPPAGVNRPFPTVPNGEKAMIRLIAGFLAHALTQVTVKNLSRSEKNGPFAEEP